MFLACVPRLVAFFPCPDVALPLLPPVVRALYFAAFVLYPDVSPLRLGNWSTFGQH
jgi:hypothetical protein